MHRHAAFPQQLKKTVPASWIQMISMTVDLIRTCQPQISLVLFSFALEHPETAKESAHVRWLVGGVPADSVLRVLTHTRIELTLAD